MLTFTGPSNIILYCWYPYQLLKWFRFSDEPAAAAEAPSEPAVEVEPAVEEPVAAVVPEPEAAEVAAAPPDEE